MKTLHDFPQVNVSPYENILKQRLNECSSNRVLSFGNARVDLEKYQNNITAKIALTQKVDHDAFAKFFTGSIFYAAKLSKTAQSILLYIMHNMPKDKGHVFIDNSAVMSFCGFKTRKSVREGVVELLEKDFIARTTVLKMFWVNPLVMFNGNRITYANEYILEEAEDLQYE